MEENIFYRGNLVTNKQGEVVIITGLPEGGIYFTGVFVKDLEKGIEKRFNSIKEASEYLGGVYSTVAGCVNRGQVFNKRFKIDKI